MCCELRLRSILKQFLDGVSVNEAGSERHAQVEVR